jgi:transcriptional regulator with XRE-family HTH domain
VVSQTIVDELEQYAVGDKLRGLRLKKKMGLVELSRHSGLSPALLSKIERGRLIPTLPTLVRIALVFSVGLEYFFSDQARRAAPAITRKKERLRFPDHPGEGETNFRFESLDFHAIDRKLNAYYVEFEAVSPERARRHQHGGVEFIYVVQGRLIVRIAEADVALEAGDSMYFDPHVSHSYRREGRAQCSAVVVTTHDTAS